MRDQTAEIATFRRADYCAPDFRIEGFELVFDLDPSLTTVHSRVRVQRDPRTLDAPFRLDGEDLEFVSASLDGHPLARAELQVDEDGLALLRPTPAAFQLDIVNRVRPAANTELMGLYLSNDSLFTQCEAEGFRRITYFPDRPDVMTKYRVTLRADKQAFPVLLSNGNLIGQSDIGDGRHQAVWDDPFSKPSYLFALVAGRFVALERTHRSRRGRPALLQVWVEPGNLDRAHHAMESLVKAIEWDEQRFGLELDLDRFMIVASNDFNGGAMENKGLNIFNAKYVLATPAIATDIDYARIESIVGHEYFHNWTGNRVTCRDWFQLSLKEGLTVFRDQVFSAEQYGGGLGSAVKRIDDVRMLRALQFPEDAGPMSHPVRPEAYQEISNFYTATVYEKGAEVVRMLHTLVGTDGFRRGMELYFRRHDGAAVTCDDFVAAIGDANQRELAQFRRWYSQSGTPRIVAQAAYDADRRICELTLSQATPPTSGQPIKEPLHIPVAVGLVGPDGRDLPLQLEGELHAAGTTRVLELTRETQRFRFVNVAAQPVPSLLRGFSAPVIVQFPWTERELTFLAAHDSDGFNRWDAVQRLATAQLLRLTDAFENGQAAIFDEGFIAVLRTLLRDDSLSAAFREQALTLPTEGFIGEQRAVVDPGAVRAARRALAAEIGRRMEGDWRGSYARLETSGEYSPTPEAAGRRALRNLALAYLVEAEVDGAVELATRQLDAATNLTDRQAGLAALINSRAPQREAVLERLAREWQHEPLLMYKWYQLQATAMAYPGEEPVVQRVRRLLRHPGFALTNPNNVYALIRSFCLSNDAEFHRRDGSGYAFWSEQVLALDPLNPTVAARVARALERWRKYTPDRQEVMRAALERVAAHRPLSRDVREIVTKSLEN
ncbi:MAG TPA: aminopeptidase N [Burkholderiaceae bacterium]|nr:aminopeptidase N [Burkholderiaceae bacterium]